MLSARIRSRKKRVTRQSTEVNLDIAKWAAKDLGGILPTDKKYGGPRNVLGEGSCLWLDEQ